MRKIHPITAAAIFEKDYYDNKYLLEISWK